MPRSGGVYTLPSPPNPLVSGTLAKAADMNTTFSDIATALTGSMPVDGSASWTGPVNFNGQNVSGINNLTVSTSATIPTLTASSNLFVGGVAYFATSGVTDFSISRGSPNRFFQWMANWTDSINESSGLRTWSGPSGTLMTLDGAANLVVENNFTCNGISTSSGSLIATGNVTANGALQGGTASISGTVYAGGTLTANTNLVVHGQIQALGSAITGVSGAPLNIGINANAVTIATGGVLPATANNQACGSNTLYWQQMWSAGGVSVPSDPVLKRDLAPLPSCLPLVTAIEPISFRWREGADAMAHWGFDAIALKHALDAAGVANGCYTKGEEGPAAVRPHELLALLWKAVRELSGEVAALKAAAAA